MNIKVANAPCSYGAFEITVEDNPEVPDAVRLLDLVSEAGYSGIDLGPVGYLGDPGQIWDRLGPRGLELAGGYLQLSFSQPERLEVEMGELDRLLDHLDAMSGQKFPPRPTLADSGSPQRQAHPGRSAVDPAYGLDDEGWENFARGVAKVLAHCRGRGYEPTLHPHAGAFVEASWEVQRVVELTEISLCFDPAHLLVGRVDPLEALERWHERINHVHLKDARAEILRQLTEADAPVEEIYSSGAFCPLGEGTAVVDQLLEGLERYQFEGWIVVEQDLVPDSRESVERAAADQRRNREYLRARGI